MQNHEIIIWIYILIVSIFEIIFDTIRTNWATEEGFLNIIEASSPVQSCHDKPGQAVLVDRKAPCNPTMLSCYRSMMRNIINCTNLSKMTSLFKKLNYKKQPQILAINAPESFSNELIIMAESASIFKSEDEISGIEFALVFVTKQLEIDELIPKIFPKLKADAVLWFCYPKGTSKKYKCDFNRDTGWEELKKYKLEPVRQVAIDDDWSALRFRKIEFIKTMTRNR
jgi:hypothetical protein